jgi:hypothetical protein
MKLIYGIILSILLISCGVTVSIDYDKEADFSKYKSYNFFPTIDSGLNELENKRIISISDSLLQQKGFIKIFMLMKVLQILEIQLELELVVEEVMLV